MEACLLVSIAQGVYDFSSFSPAGLTYFGILIVDEIF